MKYGPGPLKILFCGLLAERFFPVFFCQIFYELHLAEIKIIIYSLTLVIRYANAYYVYNFWAKSYSLILTNYNLNRLCLSLGSFRRTIICWASKNLEEDISCTNLFLCVAVLFLLSAWLHAARTNRRRGPAPRKPASSNLISA